MLILLRHAKSSWADPELGDHDRPLNKRGKAAAPAMGTWLSQAGYRPDRVLVSSSRRTRQTVDRMRETMPDLPAAEVEPRLYHAEPDMMFDILSRQPDAAQTVLLVGHQPGLSAFARRLVNGQVRPHCVQAFQHFPTAAAAVMLLPIFQWGALSPGSAEFIDFAVPREVMANQIERAIAV
ncbi:MAG: histidine phosphatase family protein [Pseudomonadota bacterium]